MVVWLYGCVVVAVAGLMTDVSRMTFVNFDVVVVLVVVVLVVE